MYFKYIQGVPKKNAPHQTLEGISCNVIAQVKNCYHLMKVWHLIVFSANFQGKVSKSPISRGIRRDKTKISTCPSFAYFNELQLNYFGSLKFLEYTHPTCKLCTQGEPLGIQLVYESYKNTMASMQKCNLITKQEAKVLSYHRQAKHLRKYIQIVDLQIKIHMTCDKPQPKQG